MAKTQNDAPVQARAKARYVRSTPRKAQLVAEQIRGLPVPEARTVLAFSKRAAARDVEKVLSSAVANAEANHHLIGDEMFVREAYVGQGPVLKRWRARARGRVGRIHKRTCHIVVGLAELDEELRALYAEQALASEPVDPEPVDDEALQDTTEAAELDADADADETAATAVDEESEADEETEADAASELEAEPAAEEESRSRRKSRQRRKSRRSGSGGRAGGARGRKSRQPEAVDEPEPAEPSHEAEPYPGYADHTAKEVIKEVGELTDDQLAAVAGQDERVTVQRAIEKEQKRRAEATDEDQEG